MLTPRQSFAAVTFNKDIAPILFARCSPCHHAGESAPFNLVTYSEVKKHSQQILAAVESDYMPPWLPGPNPAGFLNDRSLSPAEKSTLMEWITNGQEEGASSKIPPTPEWPEGWSHGKPDLVLQMPKAFTLGAEGADVYRNFVVPTALTSNVNVRLVEFRPGNAKILHHAFIKVDTTHKASILEKQGNEVGFAGMNSPATMPPGQFLTWQPGRQPTSGGPVWTLPKGSDFVFETHMNRSGKPEELKAMVGVYFTPEPAATNFAKVFMGSLGLDIKAGQSNYMVSDSFLLPVDTELVSVLPHAHYLCRELTAWADLPGGGTRELLSIRRWDFKWQGDYPYAKPVLLPKGSTVHIRYVYDNSTNNPVNPNSPPRDVLYGPQSQDEMCEFWMQLRIGNSVDRKTFDLAYEAKSKKIMEGYIQTKLNRNPADSGALSDLGLLKLGKGDRTEAEKLFRQAVESDKENQVAHYRLGLVYRMGGKFKEADTEFSRATMLNPSDEKAWGNWGFVKAELGDAEGAKAAFRKALELDPQDAYAKAALKELEALQKK